MRSSSTIVAAVVPVFQAINSTYRHYTGITTATPFFAAALSTIPFGRRLPHAADRSLCSVFLLLVSAVTVTWAGRERQPPLAVRIPVRCLPFPLVCHPFQHWCGDDGFLLQCVHPPQILTLTLMFLPLQCWAGSCVKRYPKCHFLLECICPNQSLMLSHVPALTVLVR